MTVAVIVPVYRNEATLPALAARVASALGDRPWRLRLVVDGSPDASLAVAHELARQDPRIAVTDLPVNGGQHRALTRGLADEEAATAWACLDADLQDPPEALPILLDRLAAGDVGAVFAGRRGAYESAGRLLTGRLHRRLLSRLAGLPPDAGAYVVLGPEARRAVLALAGPSIVTAIGVAGGPTTSLPVARSSRPVGRSAWTSSTRVRQAARIWVWTAAHRSGPPATLRRWRRPRR